MVIVSLWHLCPCPWNLLQILKLLWIISVKLVRAIRFRIAIDSTTVKLLILIASWEIFTLDRWQETGPSSCKSLTLLSALPGPDTAWLRVSVQAGCCHKGALDNIIDSCHNNDLDFTLWSVLSLIYVSWIDTQSKVIEPVTESKMFKWVRKPGHDL